MGVLAKFIQQPAEVLDYDVDYSRWLADRADTIASVTAAADPGVTVGSVTHLNGVVKVFISGGASGQTYKVTTRVTTAGGRVKEAEFLVKVRES